DDALDRSGFASVRSAARADIDVEARVEVTQERVDRQFQTTFAVRSYAIEVTAETTRTNEAVSMPSATTLSFDPQFGAERAAEKANAAVGAPRGSMAMAGGSASCSGNSAGPGSSRSSAASARSDPARQAGWMVADMTRRGT